MKSLPVIPASAPFTTEQRAWLNGFLAGIFATEADTASTPAASTKPAQPLLVMFGSQTGSAEGLARRFAKEASAKGFAPRVLPLNDFEKAELTKAGKLIVISSTWGDGEPPDNAVNFWSWLSADSAPRLEHLHFAVLGLGDRNYSDFCGASKKFDARLEALGANRLVPRGECDVDYETTAKAWMESLWGALEEQAGGAGHKSESSKAATAIATGSEPQTTDHPAWSRANPFPARLKTNRRLNRSGSAKDTRHFEIVLEGSDLAYEAGDALGVMPQNCPVLVEELLATLGFKGEEIVKDAHGGDRPLHEALLKTFVITQPSVPLIKDAATRAGNTELLALLDPARKADFDKWIGGRDVVDVLKACPNAGFSPVEFSAHLRKLQPRLYSISSSPKAHPGEVHLTVAAVRYESHGRGKKGVASCWLADRVVPGESPVPVFIQTSHGFRLPAESGRLVIMIGPGTGIAPFRAFLEERRVTGAKGRNWLFFGDQQRACDFLYEDELAAMQVEGTLTRLDLAFSRDQPEKIYVQNRMLEAAAEFWAWLEAGAHVYVCGDAKRMAKDVDAALHEIIERAGGRTKEQAGEYVAKLKTERRYQRDVY